MDNKPREYKGVNFRSTLEAKWAIFFDAIGWKWKYEPFKLTCGDTAWIPDFLILSDDGKEIFCEVKPSDDPKHLFEVDRYLAASGMSSETKSDLLLLGNSPLESGDCHDGSAIGWIYIPSSGQIECAMFFNGEKIGFCHDMSSWVCRISGEYHSQVLEIDWKKIRGIWYAACDQALIQEECDVPEFPTFVRTYA